MLDELPFSEVWAVDFEFRPEDGREGSRPDPVCLVAYELKGGRKQYEPFDLRMPRRVQRRQVSAQARSHEDSRLAAHGSFDHRKLP